MTKILLLMATGVAIFVAVILATHKTVDSTPQPIVEVSNSPVALDLPAASVKPVISSAPKPTPKPTTQSTAKVVLNDVPFTSQAPFGEWSDPRQEDACEEASALMAMHWAKNELIASKQAAKDEILAISQYEVDNFGDYHDTSAQDTANRLIKGYYKYDNFQIQNISNADEIISVLSQGNIVIVPTNGKELGQPNFTQPGPDRHMLVIKGYDSASDKFITNDPGIRQGENWKYGKDIMFNAIRNYTTGMHAPINGNEKVMIVIKR